MAEAGLRPSAPPLDRARMAAEIAADNAFDVVVIGGGITGAGTFRDLALQGLRVLLVERDDFASGASGALTRIAHGGFRYLERGDIGLVRESVVERDRLARNAPHAVRPIRMVLPLRSRFGGLLAAPLRFLRLLPGHGLPGVLPMAIGVRLYEALAGAHAALARGGAAGKRRVRRLFPYLGRQYTGAVWAYEGRILAPERVAVELIEDGVAAGNRSAALNYCPLVGVDGSKLTLEDRHTGRPFAVTARAVVNAGGAHADKIAALFGIAEKMTGGIAGTHLVLAAPTVAAAIGDDLLFFEDDNADPAKRRLCVLYRLAQDRLLLGTTEVACEDPDAATVTEADEHYLLQALAAALPGHAVTREAIVGRLAGVRPLVRSDNTDLTSRSRGHAIFRHQPGGFPLVTIIGGKWTTFRLMAEDAANAVLEALGARRLVSTQDLPIGGGKDFDQAGIVGALAAEGLDRGLAERLVETYGSRAPRVARAIHAHGAAPLSDEGRLTRGEVAFFIEDELAHRAEDIIRRRSEQFFRAGASEALQQRIEALLEAFGPQAGAGN